MSNFWQQIKEKKPFFCLAPMSDVTDCAFRKMLAKYGKPDVMWTEFVAADGIANKLGRKKLSHILKFSNNERPIVAQVFGANPDNMKIACQYIASLGFDGIDINMGCPDRSVISQGAGAAMIRTPALARKIIQAAKEGVSSAGQDIPISVKTRIGFNKEEIDIWIPEILKEDISALTVHARTKKEMSLVPANWNYIKKVVELVKKSGKNILVIGNGDVVSLEDGIRKAKESGCDGVMVGRGVFGKPWFFADKNSRNHFDESDFKKKMQILIEHLEIFDKELLEPGYKNFDVMKKHFKAYINGFDGAKELRNRLMFTKHSREARLIINKYLKTIK